MPIRCYNMFMCFISFARRCENGFCVNRTTCICQDGYKYDHNTTSCLPDCNDDCENGICTAPGVCRCFNGYRRSGNRCDAICEKFRITIGIILKYFLTVNVVYLNVSFLVAALQRMRFLWEVYSAQCLWLCHNRWSFCLLPAM